MLVGIKSPTKGSIFLDSVPIDKWTKILSEGILGILAEHQLFEDNISANIARYDEVDQNELKKACDLIGLADNLRIS